MKNNGFTVLELLIVIAIIGILTSIVIPVTNSAKNKAYYSRALTEYKSMATALEMYKSDNNGEYPEDANRDIPPGLGAYLSGGEEDNWPKAPWPGSVYDWDNWEDPDDPYLGIYQISIRFCPTGGDISTCKFPDEDWAEGFDVNSSVYYCIEGSCRAHINEDIDHPGYCINCINN